MYLAEVYSPVKTKSKKKKVSERCPNCRSWEWNELLQWCPDCQYCPTLPQEEETCPHCGSEDYNTRLAFCTDCALQQDEETDAEVAIPSYSEDEYTAAICRQSFYEFVKEFWDEVSPEIPHWNWHVEFLCNELQKIAERVFKGLPKEYDLIINISPGTTKSTICSIMFPAWVWTRMPRARVIGASYAYSLAMDLSRKNRDVVKCEKYQKLFPGIKIREDQDSKGYFINTVKGDRYSVGVNGAVMGMHGHFIIVDDPLDPQQAMSEAEINIANNWMSETLPSRKVDKRVTPMILIMQRLHQNDPTGFRLERVKKSPVRHICLPAEESPMIYPAGLRRFYKDGLMDPVRLNRTVLHAAYEDLGEFGYAGQHMQNPVPRGGALFHVTRLVFEEPPQHFKKIVRNWDKAGTLKGGNWTVGTKMGEDHEGRIWVLDVIRQQLDSSRREKLILNTALLDGKKVRIGIEQEGGSGGKESAENSVRNLRGFMVTTVKVGTTQGSKVNRADPFATQVNSGNVSVAVAPWNGVFKSELEYFPKGKFDDQVDSAAGAFNLLMKPSIVVGGFDVLLKAS